MHGGQTPPGWTDAQASVARQVMVEFMARGASAAGASGVVGNWYQESGLDPKSTGGYLGQWIGDRAARLQSFASQIGAPVTSVEAQCQFAIAEMQQSYPQLWGLLSTTKDPRQAALAISQQYERPAAWAANNTNRMNKAADAFQYLAGQINARNVSQIWQDGSSGGGGSGPSSILDLLTSPVETLGGWLASIAFSLIKDTAIAIGDDLIIPFWHWNQRAVDNYTQNLSGNELLWTAAFWGFGYGLLFTDPDAGNFRPAPMRRSRLARHVRTAQSVPARLSLVKPKDVERKTPKKPKPHSSRAVVTQTGTMQAVRNAPVRVTGTHARRTEPNGTRSETAIDRESARTVPTSNRSDTSRREPNSEHRTRGDSLSDRAGVARGDSGSREGGRN